MTSCAFLQKFRKILDSNYFEHRQFDIETNRKNHQHRIVIEAETLMLEFKEKYQHLFQVKVDCNKNVESSTF